MTAAHNWAEKFAGLSVTYLAQLMLTSWDIDWPHTEGSRTCHILGRLCMSRTSLIVLARKVRRHFNVLQCSVVMGIHDSRRLWLLGSEESSAYLKQPRLKLA